MRTFLLAGLLLAATASANGVEVVAPMNGHTGPTVHVIAPPGNTTYAPVRIGPVVKTVEPKASQHIHVVREGTCHQLVLDHTTYNLVTHYRNNVAYKQERENEHTVRVVILSWCR